MIDTPPPALTNSTSATVSFHSTGAGATFTCSLDGATATACTSPVTYTGLAQGSHTLTVTGLGRRHPGHGQLDGRHHAAQRAHHPDRQRPRSSTQVNLTWTPSTDNIGVTGYDVYRNGILLTTTTR